MPTAASRESPAPCDPPRPCAQTRGSAPCDAFSRGSGSTRPRGASRRRRAAVVSSCRVCSRAASAKPIGGWPPSKKARAPSTSPTERLTPRSAVPPRALSPRDPPPCSIRPPAVPRRPGERRAPPRALCPRTCGRRTGPSSSRVGNGNPEPRARAHRRVRPARAACRGGAPPGTSARPRRRARVFSAFPGRVRCWKRRRTRRARRRARSSARRSPRAAGERAVHGLPSRVPAAVSRRFRTAQSSSVAPMDIIGRRRAWRP